MSIFSASVNESGETDSDMRMIKHLQKIVAYQQLAMEIVNDAYAKATGSGTPMNEGLRRPQGVLDEASVAKYVLPALHRKNTI